MQYTDTLYLFVFLIGVLVIYQIMPKKLRWLVLLISSYIFFFSVKKWVVIYIIATTIFTYIITIGITKIQNECNKKTCDCDRKEKKVITLKYKKKTKLLLILGIVGLVATLFYTHYLNFFSQTFDSILKGLGFDSNLSKKFVQPIEALVPIGISFYTLEAIGYMVDVYWEKIKIEKHPMKLALFLSFFPQISQGPIALYSQTADQLWEGKSLKIENLKKGYIRIFWGLFKVLLISARLDPVVKRLFDHYKDYSGASILYAAIAYTIYLYMNFSGGVDISIGSAYLFGIELPENFRHPFFAKSASEFWQRWHITLGVWFKTYIFYPASVSKLVKKWNKFAKKKLSKYIAKVGVSAICLFPVWLCNGLWHGSNWNYIFYGMYYFVILLLEVALEPVRKCILKKLHLKESGFIWTSLMSIKTLIIIFIGELFFFAKTLGIGFSMFKSMFKNFEISKLFDMEYLTKLGTDKIIIDRYDYLSIFVGIVVVFVYELLKERKIVDYDKIDSMITPCKWAIYLLLIFSVALFGAYGAGYDAVALLYADF